MNQMEVKRKRFDIISSIIFLLNILVLSGILGENGVGYLAGALECYFLLILLTAYTMPGAMQSLCGQGYKRDKIKMPCVFLRRL